jgi:two-component system sensor histidine kinase ArlS
LKARNKETTKKLNSSLASRISSLYTKMFVTWIAISLVAIFVFVLGATVFSIYYGSKPSLDAIAMQSTVEELIEKVNSTDEIGVVLISSQGETLASSFIYDAIEPLFFDFFNIRTFNNRMYFLYKRNITAESQDLGLIVYNDITVIVFEAIVIGALVVLLFCISTLTIHLRGSYLTRKAFGVLDELTEKANNISSQNLNLRLNVNDSTDELIEIALTFNRMMDRIEKAYEKQNQFVSDASHELRTPISVIQGYARMLDRWGKEDKDILQESIQAIKKESENMQDLVDKLLFIARNDKDTLVLVKNSFSMTELVEELVRETILLETGRKIESHAEPDIMLYGDRDRIKQALRIFIDNAIKYTEPGQTITIRLTVEDNFAVVTVRDSGIGIPEEHLPNIFDRFFRVDTSRERNKGGHGLGLSIARIIVLRHGGRIRVASKLGEGTRFKIYFPLGSGLNNSLNKEQ